MMKAVSNLDTILIMQETLLGTLTVATFHPDSNLLVMHDDCAKYLPGTLVALRKYQKERYKPVLPIRVEYW